MTKRKTGAQYAISITYSLLAVALNYAISLLLTPYITETIGTEAYGFVSLAKTFANYAAIFTVALNSFAARYISVEYHKGDIKKANTYYNSVFMANLVLCVAIMAVASVIIWHLQTFLSIPSSMLPDVKMLFALDTINFLILSCSTVFMSAAVIQNRLELSSMVKCIAYIAEGVFLYCAFSLLPPKVYYVGIGLIISSVFILVLNMLVNFRYTPELKIQKGHCSGRAVKQLVGNGIWNSVNSLGNTLNTGLDLLVSNMMLSDLRTGQLAIVKTISTIVTTLFQLVAQPLQPLQLRYFAAGDKKQLINSFKLGIKLNGMLSNIAFAGFAIFGSVYYALWVPGQDIDLLQSVSIVVIMGSIIEGAVTPLYYAYTLTLKNKIPCYVTVGAGFCNVIAKYLLIKYCNAGIFGVVVTTAVLTWLVNFVFNPMYAASSLKVGLCTFYPALLRSIVSCGLMTAVFYLISLVYFPSTWLGLIGIALLCAMVGVLIHVAVVFDRAEVKTIFKMLSREKKIETKDNVSKTVGEASANAADILIALLRMEICGGTVNTDVKAVLSEEMMGKIYTLAHKNDLAHIAGQALNKLGILGQDEISQKFKQAIKVAAMRYVRLDYAYQQMCQTLEAAQIPFLPLKGSVLRKYYPEPWLRTSCDVDILVREDILETATDVLQKKLKYSAPQKTDHDMSMFAPNGVHLELHFTTLDEGRLPEAQTVLAGVWDDATPQTAGMYHHIMSDEMFYFYHIAHMAKHFENGGCGIRPFLDLWLLNHCVEHDADKRNNLLAQGGMLQFAREAEKLSEVWFSGIAADHVSLLLEDFVLHGGLYRSQKGAFAILRGRGKTKLQYALYKIFLPYREMKRYYPILEKHKWLTPFYEVFRWVKVMFSGDLKRSYHEIKAYAEVSSEAIDSTASLLQHLGL